MPLSEEEQRILHEMEQKLYEHDRAFVDRVRSETSRSMASRSLRWSVLAFVVGFAILLAAFRSSLLLGTFGFLVMLFSALVFERSARQAYGGREERSAGGSPKGRTRGGDDLSAIGRRLRSRLRRER